MSNKEQHVPSLELSKKLYELGVRKKSVFYWAKLYSDEYEIVQDGELISDAPIDYYSVGKNDYPAYLASELGEMLPLWCNIETWDANFKYHGYYKKEKSFFDDNVSNLIAKMLIWLIEQGHVKVEDTNNA